MCVRAASDHRVKSRFLPNATASEGNLRKSEIMIVHMKNVTSNRIQDESVDTEGSEIGL
jgi:hypothetical protein